MIEQPDLIKPDAPIKEILLEAPDSPRKAYYAVSIYVLPGAGYRIRKESGAKGSKPNTEEYWRPGLRQAMEKQASLITAKTAKKKGRVYSIVKIGSDHDQKNI